MKLHIEMRATYEILTWDDEPDTEPEREGGFTDPNNPWGGFRAEVPDDLEGEAFDAWCAENIKTVEFDTLWAAAEFVVDFPGGVWDYREGEYETNYKTGTEMQVTLHVQDHQEAVFELAATIQDMIDRRLKRQALERRMQELIYSANWAFRENDEERYEDLQERVRNLCDEHPELTPMANAAGIYGGGPVPA